MTTIEKIHTLDQRTRHAILEIWESSVRASHDFLGEEDIPRIRDQVAAALPAMTDLRLAMRDGVAVAFIACDGDMIEALFVHDHARGQGIGRHLLMDAIARGMRRVDVNEQNVQGVGFYRAQGFVVAGRSECDQAGNPFPLLHMVWPEQT